MPTALSLLQICFIPQRFGIHLVALASLLVSSAADAQLPDFRAPAQAAAQQFERREFAQLEKSAAEYRDKAVRTETGEWMLQHFYWFFGSVRSQGKKPLEWQYPSDLIDAWTAAFPKSPTPRIVAARLSQQQAMMIRGYDPAAAPQSPTGKQIRQILQRGIDQLATLTMIGASDPEWYAAMVDLMAEQGSDAASIEKVLDEGLNRHPLYHPLYVSGLQYILKRAPDDVARIEAFARAAIQRTKAKDGVEIYARLYWTAKQIKFHDKLFEVTKADWPTMKAAIKELVERFPASWNFNHFAVIACLAKDRPETERLMDLAKRQALPFVWGDPGLLQRCDPRSTFPGVAAQPAPTAPLAVPVLRLEDDNELDVREAIKAKAVAQFTARQFGALIADARSYGENKARSASGLWKLAHLYDGFERIKLADLGYRLDGPVPEPFRQFINAYPDSPVPYLAYARALLAHGWTVRGNTYAEEIGRDVLETFAKIVRSTGEFLLKHKAVAAKDPEWYAVMLSAMTDGSASNEAFLSMLDEGIRKAPGYHPIYFVATRRFLPRWFGDAETIERFARAAMEASRVDEGAGMYARIYWVAYEQEYGNGLFTKSKIDWNLMKSGMADVLKRHPDQWNVNNFVRFACIKGDAAEVQRLFPLLRHGAMPRVWQDQDFLGRCETYASAAPPPAAGAAKDDDMRQREQLTETVMARFVAGDFAALEAMAERYRGSEARLPSGNLRLPLFYRRIGDNISMELKLDDDDRVVGKLRSWQKAYPKSPTPYIAAARVYLQHAVMVKWPMYAKLVGKNAEQRAQQFAKNAHDLLAEHESVASRDPEWYAAMLEALSITKAEERIAAVLSQGARKHPGHESIYLAVVDHVGGGPRADPRDIDWIARAAMDAASPKDGKSMYARIWLHAQEHHFGWRPFAQKRADWSLMKAGVGEIAKAYPTERNVNQLAVVACMSEDRPEARRLLSTLKGGAMPDVWRSRALVRYCEGPKG